jgi:lipid-A-disaccharide synthase
MIVAGEASGDLHGANLIKEYRKIDSFADFYGIGSSNMKAAGMEVLYDSKEIAVVGIFEVLSHLRVIYRALSGLKKRLLNDKPDLLILIDFPDFNLRLAAYAKKIGVKVLYYISPQVWAWRQKRVKKMAKIIDKIAVIFPFEEEFYLKENMDVTFVGHPLADCVKPSVTKDEYRRNMNIPDNAKVITVMPGSRAGEINRLLDEMLGACRLIQDKDESYYFLVSCAPTIDSEVIRAALKRFNLNGQIIQGDVYNAVFSSDFVITKSGTSTLEIAILGIPMVIVYKVSPLSYLIGKWIFRINLPCIGLANIVAGERVVPELLQKEVSAERIAGEVLKVMGDKAAYDEILNKLGMISGKLGDERASKNTANLVKEILYR